MYPSELILSCIDNSRLQANCLDLNSSVENNYFKGAGGSLTLGWSKLSLMLFLIEESESYQMLFTE